MLMVLELRLARTQSARRMYSHLYAGEERCRDHVLGDAESWADSLPPSCSLTAASSPEASEQLAAADSSELETRVCLLDLNIWVSMIETMEQHA